MTERKEHFDEDFDLRVSPKLSADLNTLFKPQFSIPPEVDMAVMDQANRRLVRRDRRRVFRGAHLWRIAAAAAVIIFAFSLDLTQKPGPTSDSSLTVEARAVDIDRNGRVDILDAFKLARHVESANYTQQDLSPVSSYGGWDINGDGLVNRDDIDEVAYAAVRLDKGVL
jgi:hypothetical protein